MNVYNKLAKDYLRLKNKGITNHFDQFIYKIIEKEPGITIESIVEKAGPTNHEDAIRESMQILLMLKTIEQTGNGWKVSETSGEKRLPRLKVQRTKGLCSGTTYL